MDFSSLHKRKLKKNERLKRKTAKQREERDKKDEILREVELKVELPRGRPRWIFARLVHEGQAQLDDLQEVNVAAQQLVLVVGVAAELPDGPGDDARELCVLVNTQRYDASHVTTRTVWSHGLFVEKDNKDKR